MGITYSRRVILIKTTQILWTGSVHNARMALLNIRSYFRLLHLRYVFRMMSPHCQLNKTMLPRITSATFEPQVNERLADIKKPRLRTNSHTVAAQLSNGSQATEIYQQAFKVQHFSTSYWVGFTMAMYQSLFQSGSPICSHLLARHLIFRLYQYLSTRYLGICLDLDQHLRRAIIGGTGHGIFHLQRVSPICAEDALKIVNLTQSCCIAMSLREQITSKDIQSNYLRHMCTASKHVVVTGAIPSNRMFLIQLQTCHLKGFAWFYFLLTSMFASSHTHTFSYSPVCTFTSVLSIRGGTDLKLITIAPI